MKKLYLIPVLFVAVSDYVYAEKPSYSYLQSAFVHSEFEDLSPFELRGMEIRGSYQFYDQLFVEGSYIRAKDDIENNELKLDTWQLELGYIFDWSQSTKIDLKAGYGDIGFKLDSGNEKFKDSTDYYSVATNLRYMLNSKIELKTGLEIQYWDKGSNQKAYNLGAYYHFSDIVLGLGYTKYSDSEFFALEAQYKF